MSMQYEILPHTGDVKIRAFGNTKEELFLNAMLGMNAIVRSKVHKDLPKGDKRKNSKVRKIVLRSTDINSLLVDFLNEVNYLRQVNREIYDRASLKEFSDTSLEGELEGREVEEFGEDIKAVTFHELDIHQNPQGLWESIIVFDI